MQKQHHLYILSNGMVAAIDKKNGEIIWEVKLKTYVGNATMITFGQISVEDNKLFIGSAGMLLCMSTKDGSSMWKNELKGWGYGFVSFADAPNESANEAASNAASAAATSAVL